LRLLTKEGDTLSVLLAPAEKVRIGETLKVGQIVAQVIDLRFADVPGVLEHILRRSLIPRETRDIPPSVKSVLDTLADHKVAIAKIRGRLETIGEQTTFKSGFLEFDLSRMETQVERIGEDKLLSLLGLRTEGKQWARTLSTEPQNLPIPPQRFGVNLITGMKESGKSYAAKKLLLTLIDNGVVNLVFDLNAEYINLGKKTDDQPNEYQDRIRIFRPHIRRATAVEIPLRIPLNEMNAEDFARLMNISPEASMFLSLQQFWHSHRGQQFDLQDLSSFVSAIQNEAVRIALQTRIQAAQASDLFGPCDFTSTFAALRQRGGAAIVDLSRMSEWPRKIVVNFVLSKLTDITKNTGSISIFMEEAHLYIEDNNITDLVTRMRHFGVYPTFITNVPKNLPDVVYTLLDNLISFKVQDAENLRQLSSSGKVDSDTVQAISILEQGQCLVVGRATNGYPIFAEVTPVTDVKMGGETKPLA
jgi:hypothetical protein